MSTKEEKRRNLEAIGFRFDENGKMIHVPPECLKKVSEEKQKYIQQVFGDVDSVIVEVDGNFIKKMIG